MKLLTFLAGMLTILQASMVLDLLPHLIGFGTRIIMILLNANASKWMLTGVRLFRGLIVSSSLPKIYPHLEFLGRQLLTYRINLYQTGWFP